MTTGKTGGFKSVTSLRTTVIADDGGIVPLYCHPVFLAGILFVGGLGLGFGGLLLGCHYYKAKEETLPAAKQSMILPQPRIPALPPATEDEAASMLRDVLSEQGEARITLLRRLSREYPNAPETKLFRAELSKLSAADKAQLEKNRELEQATKRESDSVLALSMAMKKGVDPAKRPAMLKEIIERYPDTKGAQGASEQLQKIQQTAPSAASKDKTATADKKASEKKPDEPKPSATKPEEAVAKTPAEADKKPSGDPEEKTEKSEQETVEKTIETAPPVVAPRPKVSDYPYTQDRIAIVPLAKFIESYREALQDWDLATARIKSDALATSAKYPQIAPFGKACAKDVAALELFDRRLLRYYDTQRKQEIQLVRTKGAKLIGILKSVEGRTLTVLLEGKYPQAVAFPMGLQPEYLADLYERIRMPDDPEAGLIRALLRYIFNDGSAAKALFEKIAPSDRAYNVHEELLNQTFRGDR